MWKVYDFAAWGVLTFQTTQGRARKRALGGTIHGFPFYQRNGGLDPYY